MPTLTEILIQYQATFAAIIPADLQHGRALVLDLSGHDSQWLTLDVQSPQALAAFTQQLMQQHKAIIAIGRYAEDRAFLYQRSELFQQVNKNLRSIHLGIDLTVPVGTPVFTPLAGYIHSVRNNVGFGNYGPTVILRHLLDNKTFYTLYGHLAVDSLTQVYVGQQIKAGEAIGAVGDSEVNGGWPPHLHFQIIEDLGNNVGDFPGVIDLANKDTYLANCPDPNLILQIKALI